MKKVSVAEYAQKTGMNESTIRKYIRTGRIDAVHETVNNRKVYRIIVDDSDPNFSTTDEGHEGQINMTVEDAEIVQDSQDFQLVSMNQESFDNLINKFEQISQDKLNVLETTIDAMRHELHELRAENKKLQEQLYEEKIKAAQFEAESKIKDLRLQELEKKSKWFRKDLF